MKKNKPITQKSKAISPPQKASQVDAPATRDDLKWKSLFRDQLIGTIFGFIIGAAGHLVYPFWPIPPQFSVGSASAESPFDIPFNVSNGSKIFGVASLTLTCIVHGAATSGGGRIGEMGFKIESANEIDPSETAIYTCPLNSMMQLPPSRFTSGSISFRATYSYAIFNWEIWRGQTQEDGPFILQANLNPQRWYKGKSLN